MSRESPEVTIGVIPREGFGASRFCLKTLLERTPPTVSLIYVDGGGPSDSHRYLRTQASLCRFTLIRARRYLLPNEARSLVVREAKTPYIVFIDNDVVVTPGWLDPLVRCAKSTSACIVSPIVCLGRPFHTYIHCAGGVVEIEERVENRRLRRRLVERLRFAGRRIDEVADRLIPGPTGLAEFHCMLVRKEVFERLGNLDLNMMNTREHIDLCLSVKAAGGGIYLEPRSVVTYDQGATRSVSDVLYYIHRWSTARVLYSIRHLRRKWSLDEDRLSIGAYSWYRYLLLLPEPARPFFRWILQPQVQRVGTWIVENFARPRPRILKEGREYTVLRPDPDRNGAA